MSLDLTINKNDVKVVSKKAIIKKSHFHIIIKNRKTKTFFRVAIIRVLRRRSNIFVILEDLQGKTIICKSSGSAGIVGTKRRKRVPQVIENIFKVIYPYIKLYSITRLRIVLNTRFNACFYILLRSLEFYGIKVDGCRIYRRIAFNGCKGRKIRRI